MNLGGRIILAVGYCMILDQFGILEFVSIAHFVGFVAFGVVLCYLMDAIAWSAKELWHHHDAILRNLRGGES